MGKSRLAGEFLASASAAGTVLRGRCLPYGEGITFWPVVEMVREAAGISDEDTPEAARRKVAQLVDGEEHGPVIAERVGQVVGLVRDSAVPEETFWAVRKLLEALARRKPLVLVLDDAHWGEPGLLDLVEHIADWTRDAPVLLLCLASAEAVGAPYVELAMLNTSASDPVGNDKLIQNMKEKAATLGANAILLKGFGSQMGGPGLVSSAFVAKPTGQSVAIWVPRDSANIQARCAAADTARAVR